MVAFPKDDGFGIASGLCRMISRQPTDNGCFDQAIRHDPAFGIVQSVFRPAARRSEPEVTVDGRRRDGGLKTDCAKPLHDWSAYGY